MEELETSPEITTAVIGSLKHVRSGTTPSIYSFDNCFFGGGITISETGNRKLITAPPGARAHNPTTGWNTINEDK